jgi:hypothetical protein
MTRQLLIATLILGLPACGDDAGGGTSLADPDALGDAGSDTPIDAVGDSSDAAADLAPDFSTDTPEGDRSRDSSPGDTDRSDPLEGDQSADSTPEDADVGDDSADATRVPLVSEILECGTPAGAGNLNRGNELQRHDIDIETFPDALCNDGTGAVFYFRPHSGDTSTNRWVIQLQGGGGCRSGDSCADRWCSVGTNFGMTQMTANLAPEDGINGAGILDRRAANPLGNANQVFIRYCSSDSWSGTARNVVFAAQYPRTDEPIEMRVHFLGSRIIDAVFSILRQDGVDALNYTLGEGSVALPDIDDAEFVVLAGASAGGAGATQNADRVGELLRANNTSCDGDDCPLEYRVIIDSSFGPSRENYDFSETPLCTEHGLCDYATHQQASSASVARIWQQIVDTSCLAFHEEDDDQWRCGDTEHVIRHHITTPMLVRMGQRDSLKSGNAIDTGFRVDGEPLDLATFARLVREQLAATASIHEDAEEADEIDTGPAIYGPTCAKHETLRNNAATYNVRIDVDGDSYTMFDIFLSWVREEGPRVAIAENPDDNVCP